MRNLPILEAVIEEPAVPADACVIWLHGLGADGHDFAGITQQLQLPKQSGIRFIFPHAPERRVTCNNGYTMRAWYDIYSLNDLTQEDRAGIESSEKAILQLIQQQQATGIAASRIILAGFSQGGAMALFTGLRSTVRLGGIVGLSTYLPLIKDFNQSTSGGNLATPIFLAHGEQDMVLPLGLGQKARDHLLQAGYTLEWRQYPMGHQVCLPEIAALSQWLQNTLSAGAAKTTKAS